MLLFVFVDALQLVFEVRSKDSAAGEGDADKKDAKIPEACLTFLDVSNDCDGDFPVRLVPSAPPFVSSRVILCLQPGLQVTAHFTPCQSAVAELLPPAPRNLRSGSLFVPT